MKRLFDKFIGGRVRSYGVLPFPEALARSPVFSSARTLEAAIDAATFIRREPDEDGERIAVFCNALGGAFIYSRKEAERRILLKFPGLVLEDVAAAARFLDDRMRIYLKPIQAESRIRSSWVSSWRDDY